MFEQADVKPVVGWQALELNYLLRHGMNILWSWYLSSGLFVRFIFEDADLFLSIAREIFCQNAGSISTQYLVEFVCLFICLIWETSMLSIHQLYWIELSRLFAFLNILNIKLSYSILDVKLNHQYPNKNCLVFTRIFFMLWWIISSFYSNKILIDIIS